MGDETNPTSQEPNAKQGNPEGAKNGVIEGKPGAFDQTDPNKNGANPYKSPKPAFLVRVWHGVWRKRIFFHHHPGHEGPNWAEKTSMYITGGILIATFLQALIYSKQANIMRDSLTQNERSITLGQGQLAVAARSAGEAEKANDISRESLESVQRAFVIFQGNTFDASLVPDSRGSKSKYLDFIATWENAGTTSANVTGHMYDIHPLRTEPSENEFRLGVSAKPQHLSRYIGPHGPYAIGPNFAPLTQVIANTPDSPTRPTKTGKRLFFWGWMVYQDVFPHSAVHVTEFCRSTNLIGMKAPPSDGVYINFGFCLEHNCADEQCNDYKEITSFVEKRP
jgi:hypothetical protein